MELQDSSASSATTVLYVSRNTSLKQMMKKKIYVYLLVWLCQVLIVACKLIVAACGIKFPDQGLNSGPLYWKQGVCTTGPVGKSPVKLFLK